MVGQDLNLRQSAPYWRLEGGERHFGEAFDSHLVPRYRCDVGRSSGLEDRVAGTAGERKGLFLLSLLAPSFLGAVGSFWQMCVYVWSLSPRHAVLRYAY